MLRALLLAVLLPACGLSPRAYCDEVARVTCERLFACAMSEAERDALRAMFTDEATCTARLRARTSCSTLTEATCGSRKWSGPNALACVQELERLSCEELATFRPTCASPCQ
jgi:hypothetical protein